MIYYNIMRRSVIALHKLKYVIGVTSMIRVARASTYGTEDTVHSVKNQFMIYNIKLYIHPKFDFYFLYIKKCCFFNDIIWVMGIINPKKQTNIYRRLDCERSDECIDFTMMFITSRNNAPISNFGCGFRCKSEYPWCIIEFKSKHFLTVFKKIEKNKKKMTENGNFYAKQVFDQIDFLYGCNSKTNDYKYLKFSPNFQFLRNLSKMQKFANNFERNDNDLSQTILNICYYSKSFLIKLKIQYEIFHKPLKHKPPFSPTTGNYILG
ncbi:Uncharacterized protein FWK35_00001959 [Aphis craccivora]|uniref:Uncharacterized protein n=1 Tax=Aphis craccivora TaxID=307492 RepID=A0A6G0ZK24_APHCR|nr:Uncharacterized protein FWK35_00001959 [Aphis craccivora]